MTARRSWTTKLAKALAADTPTEVVRLAKERGYSRAECSQAEYIHSLGQYVLYNVKGSKMLVDPFA
jgi:hypothetical protein